MFEMEEVHLVLETSRERHDILEEGVGQVGHHLDQEQSRELTTIFNKFTQELHEVNRSIDYVYTKWSSFPSNPGKEKCGKYLKTGSCAFGAKCKFDHPFQEPVKPSVEKDVLLFLTFITERLMKILKTFSYEAAVDVLSSLCSIVTLLESYYDLALTHPSYGQICYLYGDVIIRLSVDIDKFCSNKLSQKRTTPRFKRKGIELPDSNLNVFELCAERLETLNQKWLDWEENIRKETVHQLEESDASVSHITDQLSHSITQYAQDTLAHLESWALIREEIRRNLLTIFRQTWPEIDLIPFGSHENYLGTRNSDLDLTLQYQGDTAAVDILDIVGRIAEEAGYMLREVVKETRVPVCKLYDESYCIEVI